MIELEKLEMLVDEEIPQATSHNHILLHLYHRHHTINMMVVVNSDDHGHRYHVTKHANHEMHGNGIYYDDDPLTQIKYQCTSFLVSGFTMQSNGCCSSSFFSTGHSLSDIGSSAPLSLPLEDLKSTLSSGISYHFNTFRLASNMPMTSWLMNQASVPI